MNPANYTTISFPGLGLELNPPRGFALGPVYIHFYGLIIAVGLLLAVVYGLRQGKKFGIREDDILDGVLWIAPIAIICARIYYCIFRWQEEYADNPISALYIWNGGLAIYGSVIGAALSIIVYTRIKKIKLTAVLDLVALGFLIGQCIGRWGNFFNREAFGAETTSFLRMGLLDKVTNEYTYYHPTFLYESVWNLAGFVGLHFLVKKRRYDGQIALGYVAWYGLGRTMVEGLRMDSLYLGPIRVSQLLAAISCFIAVVILLWQAFRPHDREKLFVNQVAAREAALAADAPAEPAEPEPPEPEAPQEPAEPEPPEEAE